MHQYHVIDVQYSPIKVQYGNASVLNKHYAALQLVCAISCRSVLILPDTDSSTADLAGQGDAPGQAVV